MTKKQYLAKLRKYLLFRLSNSEIGDILSDMEECFEAGAAEGKSEEEICLSLGEPKTAAASLLGEQSVGERAASLAEVWLPFLISAALFAAYTYCGFKVDTDTQDYVLPIMYILPLIMWICFERKSFFTALADYKCDFFTFIGSAFMIAAGAACNEIPATSALYNNSDPPIYVVITAVFVSAAMIMLAVSLWRNAPKPFSVLPPIGIFFIVYKSVKFCQAYGWWNGDRNDFSGIGAIYGDIMTIIFVCASAFLIWSFISRNALTLASAYSAITVTGFVFYWYYVLATMDPTDSNSLVCLKWLTGMNYLIWGAVIAAAVLVMTVIVKLAKRISGKRGG